MDYREICDFESRKILSLFNLLKSTDKGRSLEYLSSKLALNSKTILRAMKKMKRLFKQYQLSDHLSIGIRARNHFYLKRDNDLYLELFFVKFLNDIPEIAFLKAIMEQRQFQTEQLAESLSISESSLRRRMQKIKQWLKKFNIYLKRGTYELMGEEEQIRMLILHFYWFVYQGTESRFLYLERSDYEKLTDLLVSFFQLQINDLQKESLFRIIKIAIWRYKQGKKIQIKKEWRQYIEKSSIFLNFIKATREEKKVLLLDFEELTYLYLIIQALFFPYFGSSMQAYLIEEHYFKKTTCYSRTLIVTSSLKQAFWNKDFGHSKASVVAFLGFHLYYEMITGLPFEKHQSISELKENFPSFMCKLSEGISELVENNSFYQRIPKDSLFYRYFMILSSLISPVYNEKRLFVCLMTDLSLEKEMELGERISIFFKNKLNLVVIYARTSRSISYADVILTTTFCQSLDQKYKQPVIYIEPDFSEKVIFKIEKIVKKL